MSVSYASNNFGVSLNTGVAGTGTITAVATTVTINGVSYPATQVTGVGTNFTTQLQVGSLIAPATTGNFTNMLVYSIASNTSLIALTQSNTSGAQTISTAYAFLCYAPTLWSDLVTAVNAQAATIATANDLGIQFKTASLSINDNAVLVMDRYSTMDFGSSGAYRLNTATNGMLVFRNGGSVTYNGNVQHSFFNGWLNVFNGVFTYQLNSPGGTARQDMFSANTKSNCVSQLDVVFAGGTATAWSMFCHLEGFASKISALNFRNNLAAGGSTAGYVIQFGNGTYNNVVFPSTTSTLGFTVLGSQISPARSGGTSTLVKPVFPGSSVVFSGDFSGNGGICNLIDESWPNLSAGTLGTITKGGNAYTTINRQFTWYPGTYYTDGNWNVRIRDSAATPNVARSGLVTSAAGVLLTWQKIAMLTYTVTNYSPFKLLARKPGYTGTYKTFTPTTPITEAFIPAVDATYTSNQSSLTGISASNSTNTITLSSGTFTIDQQYDWFQWWMAQDAQMVAYPDVARVDSVSGANWILPTGWTETLSTGVTVNEGTKLTYYYIPTITLNGTAKITSVYGTTAGVSTVLEYQNLTNNGAVCIWDYTTGTTDLYQLNTSGSAQTYTLYFPPGSAGTQKNVARELYGYQRAGETITLAAGKMLVTYSDIEDVGISQTTQATVAAYTTLETVDKLYDYVAYKRLSANWIKLGQVATREGTAVNFGTYSGRAKSSNAQVMSDPAGGVIYFKANQVDDGTKYDTIIATPPATWEGDTVEAFNCSIQDGNGDSSITIAASGISTFEIWKITDATAPDDYATGTLVDTVGTGKWRFLHSDGYKFVVRDTTTNFRVVSEAERGDYNAELYFGPAVQLAQAPDVTIIKNNLAAMQIDVDAIQLLNEKIKALSDLIPFLVVKE